MSSRVEVLLVEDSASDAQLIIEALSDEPEFAPVIRHVVRLADALAVVEVSRPTVIIYDLNLPDATGLEGIETLSLHAPDVPIIVMTWRADDEIALGAIRHRAQDYIVKDALTPELIRRTVRYAVARHHMTLAAGRAQLHDDETGLFNALGLSIIGEQRIKDARRRGDPLLLVTFRFDDRESPGADLPIVELARIVGASVRESDVLARIDHNEICGLCIGNADHPISLESIRTRIDELIAHEPSLPQIGVTAVEWTVDRSSAVDSLLAELENRITGRGRQ